jgi:hypothetical protein
LDLNKNPKLVIVDTYKKMTKGRENRINEIENLFKKHNIEYEIIKINEL